MLVIKKQRTKGYKQLVSYSTTPQLDIDIIIANTLEKEKEYLYSNPDQQLTEQQQRTTEERIKQRQQKQPIAYIIQKQVFYNRTFFINSSVLIPRPETELLIEHIQKESSILPKESHVLDIGTGSGCLITTLAKELHDNSFHYHASDISEAALGVAQKNWATHCKEQPMSWYHSHLLKNIPNQQFEIIIANLPYVPENDYETTPTEEIYHEPKIAITTEDNGLSLIKELLNKLPATLTTTGTAYFEWLPDQYKKVENYITTKKLPLKIVSLPDFTNQPRFGKITRLQ